MSISCKSARALRIYFARRGREAGAGRNARACAPGGGGARSHREVAAVLSRTTEEYDRGEKFEHYKRLPSIRQYVLVAHDKREIEVWSRGEAAARAAPATLRRGQVTRSPS